MKVSWSMLDKISANCDVSVYVCLLLDRDVSAYVCVLFT